MATLGTTFAGAWLSMRGGEKVDKSTPPINAKSKDEESFVKYGSPLAGNETTPELTLAQGLREEGRGEDQPRHRQEGHRELGDELALGWKKLHR